MKPLELTEDQRNKLLEMCKELFPEYDEIHMYVNGGEYWRDEEYIAFSSFNKEDYTKSIYHEIHWFEFCMTHLLNSLAFMFSKTDIVMDVEFEEFITDAFGAIFFDLKHPVDYLYERYLTIKK